MKVPFISLFLFLPFLITAQSYVNYHIGNEENIMTNPVGGICMMGGATENDNALRWFLERSSGGDILILRTSGSDSYNDYFYSELGVSVNSVETIVFNTAEASTNSYVLDKILKAEAIWFAGGNQWDYVNLYTAYAI